MKIDARRTHELKQALQQGATPARVRQLIEDRGVTAAELRQVLHDLGDVGDAFAADERKNLERLLASSDMRSGEALAGAGPGRRALDVRANQSRSWWSGVHADPLPPPAFPEPPRDVEVHGERFTRSDVLFLLRQIART